MGRLLQTQISFLLESSMSRTISMTKVMPTDSDPLAVQLV